jgi:hypothetical protein
MATVDKNFRVKNGLIVEGTTAKVDDKDILLDGDSTDLLVEGETNLFYTDGRVKDVLTGAVQENISITAEEGVLTITAENGVGDSTTDDLEEGETNLYYTDERVRAAVSAGDGLSYDDQSGEFSASLGDGLGIDDNGSVEVVTGNGLEIGANGEIQIDTAITIDVDSEQTISNKTLGSSLDADNNKITNLDSPTESGDAANKGYVDAFVEGLHIHESVAATTEENINLASPPSTIDGVTLVEGMRILVKDQTNATQNGIYVFEDGSLVRAEDHDTAAEIQAGDFVFVSGGTLYGATGWVQVNNVDTLGTDSIEWTQFSGAGTFTAGNGLQINGVEFSIDTSVTVDVDSEQTLTNKTIDGEENTLTNIDNDSLVNSSVTVNDAEVALGESITLTTDDIDEAAETPTNLYFTDQRAQDAVTQNLTTDDLNEGETNLYFTDQRAVDALEAINPNFAEIEINSVSKQVASTVNVADAETPTVAYSFDGATYRSAKFIVKGSSGSHTQISEVLITLDTSDNVAITEYAIVSTNGNLIEVTAAEATGDVQIIVEAANANTVVTVFGTLIA